MNMKKNDGIIKHTKFDLKYIKKIFTAYSFLLLSLTFSSSKVVT